MIRIVLCPLFFVLILGTSAAQTALQKSIDRFAALPMMKHASISICVLDVETGKELASHDGDRSLIPASSLKVVTTATALAVLGEEYRFKTELQYDGQIDAQGTLNGNLYIKGYGDPTLGSDQIGQEKGAGALMQKFVAAIQQAGIKRIEGHVVGDASAFETAAAGRRWLWEDLGNYYGSGVWGLNIYENMYKIDLQQKSSLGARPEVVEVYPTVPNLLLINELASAAKGSGDNAYIFGSPWNYTRFIRGTIPVGSKRFTIKGSVPDPPFWAAHLLQVQLGKAGIEVKRGASSLLELHRGAWADKERTSILTHRSVPLSQIVRRANLKSVNLYCDAMLKALGMEQRGEGSTQAGLAVIADHWKKKGFDPDGFHQDDGSGLSVRNAVSAHHLASVMQLMAREEASFEEFKGSLPLAGRSGTMKYLLRGSSAEGKLWAKSGGMERVRSYTGYLVNKRGRSLSFCMIANNFAVESRLVRREMEKLMLALYEE
ncbi:MAG: D-alanyl-D-alanine carboxypeptidase/D-alanyl-D-alanine-endopeptidase [Bacteroidota bacterium]